MAQVGDDGRTVAPGVVVYGGGVGQHDRIGDQWPKPAVASTNLFLRDGVPSGDHTGDGQLFGHHHDVDCRVVPGGTGLPQQVEVRGMREHGLGDEGLTPRNERLPGRPGNARRIVGVGLGLAGPTLLRNEVGVDQAGAGEDGGQGEANEGRLAGSIGPTTRSRRTCDPQARRSVSMERLARIAYDVGCPPM